MAHTVSVTADEIEGASAAVYATLTFSGTYATGGETIVPSTLGLSTIKSVDATVSSMTTAANVATFLASSGKLRLVVPAGTEVANGASLTGVTATVRVLGA